MKRNHILLLVLGLVVSAIVIYTFQGEETEESYTKQIIRERKATHDFMLTSDDSPFRFQKENFDGLAYYSVDPRFRVRARYEPLAEREIMVIPTSTGEEERYVKAGYAHFSLSGKEHKLLLLRVENSGNNDLFLAFADETSGGQTYGGGRYINISPPKSLSVTIDFNLAYNPYCAYNPEYSCPLPPRENILDIPITAGEKVFKNFP